MDKLHVIFLFLEGKKQTIGLVLNAVLAFLLGRQIVAPDVIVLLLAIESAFGITAVMVSGSKSYQDKLGAINK